jgi:beta-lactamase regulating signal transducer with metallopeptidase domain
MNILATHLREIIGLTILHSLWQITLLWIVLFAVLRLWPKASSAVRYTLAISTLILSVLVTGATVVYEWQLYATSGEVSAPTNITTLDMHTAYISAKQTVLSTIVHALNTSVPILAWLWCAGLVVMGARFGGSFFYLRTLRAQKYIAEVSPVLKQELKRLSRALDLRCDVAIATSARITSPVTLGSISPIILLPAGLLSGLSTAQIEAILVHELYHIKRRDYIINICQALIEVLLFYHPAIWHINNIIREERENCCDDQTLAFCGDAITYARALTQIQEINTLPKPTLAMSATGSNAGSFSNRIKRLFKIYPNPAQARSKGMFAIGFLIVYLGIVLASANISTAQSVERETKPLGIIVNDLDTLSITIFDSIPGRNQVYVSDIKDVTPLRVAREKIALRDLQPSDPLVKEQNLDKCLDKVRLMLEMSSIYRLRGERFKISDFVEDSLQLTREAEVNRYYGTLKLSTITRIDLIDRDNSFKILDRVVVDSIILDNQAITRYDDERKNEVIDVMVNPGTQIEELRESRAVQVFPNSTNGNLNISFTPSRNGSHIRIVLVDSNGKVVKEITDSTYDNVPTQLHVDVSSYKKGIYILQINIDGAKSQERVVVE